MPTPSEIRIPNSEIRTGDWAARTDTPRRSVFGNYRATAGAEAATVRDPSGVEAPPQPTGAERGAPPAAIGHLQSAIDLAVARSFIHRFIAKCFENPTLESWTALTNPAMQDTLRVAVSALAAASSALRDSAGRLLAALTPSGLESFTDACLVTFGHAARGPCPLNEIEYGELKADPLFQPHRLADLAAFYRAFGLEVADDAGERHDHICLELEFMCVLAAKEAYALEHQLDADQLAQCRDAQKQFLREHLGRWTPAFTRRLAAATHEPTLRALADFTRAFIETECARFGVKPGSEDLLLRPVDEAAERMCDSCGLASALPGAMKTM
jgi:DMSO reductase family type II enzyme chaperone